MHCPKSAYAGPGYKFGHALDDEKQEAIAKCDPIVVKVLTQNNFTRHTPLQRELAYVFNIPDWGAVPSLMCGIPMVGHAVWVPEMMYRNKPPVCSIQDVIDKSKQNNYKMLSQTTPAGDAKLDEKAWSKQRKPRDEFDRGIAFLV